MNTTPQGTPCCPAGSPCPEHLFGNTESVETGSKSVETRCPHRSIVQLEQGDKITTQCTACGKKMKVVEKPKCSCYGGFDCEVCNPDYYEECETSDTTTPRTDALADTATRSDGEWEVVPADFARQLERELNEARAEVAFWKAKAYEAEASEGKLEAELKEMRSLAKRRGERIEQLEEELQYA